MSREIEGFTDPELVCIECLNVSEGERPDENFFVELIAYSLPLWLRSNFKGWWYGEDDSQCPYCKAKDAMIPTSSDLGKEIMEELYKRKE